MEDQQYSISEETTSQNLSISGYRFWPFDATSLFYTDEEDILASQNPSFKKAGIFSYRHACGFVYEFADRVFSKINRCVSVVIIQSKRNVSTHEAGPANGNRIDLELMKHVGGASQSYPLCGRGSNCKSEKCCEKCELMENSVANSIIGAEVANYRSPHKQLNTNTTVKRIQDALHQVTGEKPVYLSNVSNCDRYYVEECSNYGHLYYKYNCPMSLVGGVMMPIVVNSIVIAAVIVGQFIWSDDHLAAIRRENKTSFWLSA